MIRALIRSLVMFLLRTPALRLLALICVVRSRSRA